MSTTYAAHATRWDGGWELHITDAAGQEIGVTQCRTLDTAEDQVRDYLASLYDDDAGDGATVHVVPELGELVERVVAARQATRDAKDAEARAAAESRAAARELRREGLSVADSAYVMGVSRGRISQLVKN